MSGNIKILMLIRKYLDKELSPTEEQELTSWIDQHEDNRLLFDQLTNTDLLLAELKKMYAVDKEAGWQSTLHKCINKYTIANAPFRLNYLPQ